LRPTTVVRPATVLNPVTVLKPANRSARRNRPGVVDQTAPPAATGPARSTTSL
jgi:hypothetical protein